MHALSWVNEHQAVQLSRTALDILSIGAPILIPRLAFNLMSENMLFVSLRGMMSDFLTLTLLAVWCFGGFLLSLKWLHAGHHKVRQNGQPIRDPFSPTRLAGSFAKLSSLGGHHLQMDDLDLVRA